MALSNYTDLKTSIATWISRGDLTSLIDDFIDLAEAEFNRVLRTEQMITDTTLTTSSTGNSVSLPSDFLEIASINFSTSPKKIDYVNRNALNSPTYSSTSSGRPWGCALKSAASSGGVQRLQFNCTPDGVYTLPLSYYAKIPSLSTSQTTNWFLTKEPQAYLFGCLDKALFYIEDPARRAEIESKWKDIKFQLDKETGRRRLTSGSRVTTDSGVV